MTRQTNPRIPIRRKHIVQHNLRPLILRLPGLPQHLLKQGVLLYKSLLEHESGVLLVDHGFTASFIARVGAYYLTEEFFDDGFEGV